MDVSQLKIRGQCRQDEATLDKFSRDMSAYRIRPALVVEPRDEEDVIETLTFARNEGLGIVSRSGGSDLSGAAVGPGIVLNFKKYMNREQFESKPPGGRLRPTSEIMPSLPRPPCV